MSPTNRRISGTQSAGSMSFGIKALCVAAGLLLSCTGSAFAAGTPAGTLIQTRSAASYGTLSGAHKDTSFSDLVTVTVLQKAAVNILPASAAQTAAGGGTHSEFALTVTNSGNGTDRFQISALSSSGWAVELYFDANGDGVLQPGELAAGQITQTAQLSADASYKLILRVMIPPDQQLNGRHDTASVKVQSAFNASIAIQGTYSTTIQSASLTGSLTVSNPAPSPGENVIFTCTFTNTGSVRADSILISNLLISGFTFVSASGGIVNSSLNPITWSVGPLDPGAYTTVLLTAQINPSVAPGTVLYDQMAAAYTASTGSFTTESNIAQVTVGSLPRFGVTIIPQVAAATGECNDTITYLYRVTNTGNRKDGVTLKMSSSLGFPWNLYRDANNNGRWDAADPILAGGTTTSGAVIDSVAAGDSVRIFAVVILPNDPVDQDKDLLRMKASSASNGTSDSATVVTTINAPNVGTPQLSIVDTTGSELTYSIGYSNTGHAAVESFTVVGIAPESTDYVSNSVMVDGIAAFDEEGSVHVTTDALQRKVITVTVGKLSGAKNGSVEFKVKIK